MAVKVTFDIANKLIIVKSGVTELDVKVDLYSDTKEDWESGALDIDSVRLNKVRLPFVSIGGNDTAPGEVAPMYLYLRYGWRVRPQEASHKLSIINGALLVLEDTTIDPFVNTLGAFNVRVVAYVPIKGTLLESGTSGLTSEELATLNRLKYMVPWVFIDEDNPTNGDGTMLAPFNVIADAVDFAEANNMFNLMALSDITLERTMKNFTISSIGTKTIDFAGQNVDKSEFERVALTGEQVGEIGAKEVVFLSGLTGLKGKYLNVALAGDAVCGGNTFIASLSTVFDNGHVHHAISMGSTVNEKLILDISKVSGALKIQHCNHADKLATIKYGSGHIELDNTNTLGEIGIAGLPDTAVTDNTGAGCNVVTIGNLPGADTIAETTMRYER